MIELPGWTCPICLTFNGEEKRVIDTCRHCDLPKAETKEERADLLAIGLAIRHERAFIVAHFRKESEHLLKSSPRMAANYAILGDEIERLPLKLRSRRPRP
jgi:hypothetical protein